MLPKVQVASSDTILPTRSNHSPNGFIGENTPILEGRKVSRISWISYYDLEIIFEEDYQIRFFCDVGPSREDYEINWEFNLPAEHISIEINNHFEMKLIEESFESI